MDIETVNRCKQDHTSASQIVQRHNLTIYNVVKQYKKTHQIYNKILSNTQP
jgi:hypothetical protein